jgi:radical SAM superfamily enzyme YgiQ (UPF0313 family)
MTMAPMPLGLGYVAQAIRRARQDDEIEIVDGRVLGLGSSGLDQCIRDFDPDVVGITATIMDSRETHALARTIKAVAAGIRVVVGGPYASSAPEVAVEDANIDVAVIGEGEATIVELLDAFESRPEDLSQVKGIAYRENGTLRRTGPRPPLASLDGIEPAWDLLKPAGYFSRLGRNAQNRIRRDHRVAQLFTSRGCPYNCIFCHNIFGKKIRYMDADAVLDQIALLVDRFGAREIEFVDDCFNHSLERSKEIFAKIAARDLDLHISFPNGLRADRLDEELLDLFQAAGVYRVSYAVESASPRVQRLIHKNLDLDRIGRVIDQTVERGILTVGFFILGFPTETVDEMKMTVDYAVDSAVHVADFFYLAPYPGTDVARAAGLDPRQVSYSDFSEISVNLSAATDEQLHAMAKSAYRRFYLDPRRVARILAVSPKNLQLVSNALITLRLLFQDAVAR